MKSAHSDCGKLLRVHIRLSPNPARTLTMNSCSHLGDRLFIIPRDKFQYTLFSPNRLPLPSVSLQIIAAFRAGKFANICALGFFYKKNIPKTYKVKNYSLRSAHAESPPNSRRIKKIMAKNSSIRRGKHRCNSSVSVEKPFYSRPNILRKSAGLQKFVAQLKISLGACGKLFLPPTKS